jgi:phosphoglycerate dehydrogenase-like enzyme
VLPEADVVFGALNAEMLSRAKNLRWMQTMEAGMEHVLFPELIKSNVVVTNMARMFAPGLGDTYMSMLLALTRAHYGFNMKILATDAKPLAKPSSWTRSASRRGSLRWFRRPTGWSARLPGPSKPRGCSMRRFSGP